MKTILNRIFPSRQSEPTETGLPEDHRLYCIGDIHGCLNLLEEVHQKITEDAADYSGNKILVYLGDYIDRGKDSRQVVECVLGEYPPDFRKVFLLGNHEQVLLEFLSGNNLAIAHDWFMFGGLATLRSYGVEVQGIPIAMQFEGLRSELAKKMPMAHQQFFQQLQLNYELGGYFFVHAGVRPKVKLQQQRPEDMLWIREEFIGSDRFHGKIIVHGHHVTAEPVIQHNRIGLDTGAYSSGKLTCAVFEGTDCRLL